MVAWGAMSAQQDLPIISFPSREAWERWLEEHHATSGGLWLKIAKKPETRARRIEKFVTMLSEHKKIYP
ncbi:YdeI/OmpD-associated family protein [Carbonactinospora thermoautotrophica]|nr:YdeI/OmpD-associated family protein [Carbonactinospora thermoautotrophica]